MSKKLAKNRVRKLPSGNIAMTVIKDNKVIESTLIGYTLEEARELLELKKSIS